MLRLLGFALGSFVLAFVLPLAFIRKRNSLLSRCSLLLTLLGSILSSIAASIILWKGNSFSYTAYSYSPAISFSFLIDQLAAFFILIISVVTIAVTIYSWDYVKHVTAHNKKNFLTALLSLFVLSMLLIIAAKNMIPFLFFWELMAILSYFLVMFDYEQKTTAKAGIFYFVMTILSTVLVMTGFFLIYHNTGIFEFTSFNGASPVVSTAFILLLIGFGIKAGIVPFHKWLPYAHAAAPSPISALMSGVMIKVAIYGFLRVVLFVFPTPLLWWGIVVLLVGTISALLGVIYALKEHDIKRLLAYHSIENIGIIFIAIGLYLLFQSTGLFTLAQISLAAALFHTLNHALFKSLLFLAAGSVINSTETRNIEEMGGLMKRMPATAWLFLIGAISISALPPFNGFVSELMIFQTFFQSTALSFPVIKIVLFLCLALFALTSALAAACFVKAFGIIFLAQPRSQHAKEAKEAKLPMIIGESILALFCLGLGLFSAQIFSRIGAKINVSFGLPNLLFVGILMIAFAFILFVVLRIVASRKTKVSETWGCGAISQQSTMEYTASGFSEPIVTIFSPIYHPQKINQRFFFDSANTQFKEGLVEIHLLKFFEEYLYLPVARGVEKVSSIIARTQNQVDIDPYLLWSFLTIITLIVIAGVIL